MFSLALLTVVLAGCSNDDGAGPGEEGISSPPSTRAPIISRQLEDPIDDRVNPTVPETPTTLPGAGSGAPILHILGSVAGISEPSPAWQAAAPVVLDDVATIATLSCDPTTDGCSPAGLTAWALGGVELINVATADVANATGDLDAAIAEIRNSGIEVIGYGTNEAAAIAGITVQGNGLTVSLHSISLNADAGATADETGPGIVGPEAFDSLLAEVSARRSAGDAVVVFIDVGATDDRAPTVDQIQEIQRLVELDVEAVVGSGSDFLQRFDRVANTSVAYNLGHAVTQTAEPLRADSAVLRLEFGTPGRACLLPSTASASGPALDSPSLGTCGQ